MPYYQSRFSHLGEIERKRIPPTPDEAMRLHRLERPVPWHDGLVRAMKDAIEPANFYPDYSAFYDRLALFVGVSKERLVVGAGIEDLIRSLFILAIGKGDSIAYTWPTCAMFDVYASVFGACPTRIFCRPDGMTTIEDIIWAVPKDARLVLLPNPGQPVETNFSLTELRALAKVCRGIGAVLAIDEAYYGFGADTALPLVDEFDNVLILRTFSKAFGGAALRVGYAIGQRAVIGPLDAIRSSGEVAGPSMAMATVLMDRWDEVQRGIMDVTAGRDLVREVITEEYGLKTRGHVANHVLIDMGTAEFANKIGAKLWENGCRVKYGFPAPVDRHLLVTCGPPALMRGFLREFRLVQ